MSKKKTKKRSIILIVVLLIIIATVIILTLNKSDDALQVTVETVSKRTITQTVTAIGTIEPETKVKVSSQTSGEIIFLGVEEGDTVKKNDILVKIKPDIIETQLEQYKAAVDAAKMDIDIRKAEMNRQKSYLERIKELYEKEFVSKDDFERAKTAYDQAVASYKSSLARSAQTQASLKQIQRSAERTIVYAPMDGIITKLNVELGEKVVGTEMMAGTEMMIVSDLSVMNAEVEVDENDIVLISLGDTADIEIDAFPNRIFKGYVIEIGHSAITNQLGTQDQVTNFKVKIRLIDLDEKLRPGMSCSVDIKTETRYNVIAIPLQAVTLRAQKQTNDENNLEKSEDTKKIIRPPSIVFLAKGDKVKQTEVKTGINDDSYIEIIDGLKEGDSIVTGSFMAVSKELTDGSKIKYNKNNLKKKYGK